MPVDIPGFYYDEEKKKYFKIVSNSNNRDNQYSSTSLKHKRDEEEIKQKISKMKIQQTKQANIPFVLTDAVLGMGKRLSYHTIDSEISNYYHYRLSSIQLHDQIKFVFNTSTSNSMPPVRKIMRDLNDLIVARDGVISYYDEESISVWPTAGAMSPDGQEILSNSEHMILRNIEQMNVIATVATWCGTMNSPSLIKVLGESEHSMEFKNESVNSSKCTGIKMVTCSDKSIHLIDFYRYDVFDSIHTKGDCLCLDFQDSDDGSFNELYLGYRNSTVKVWDTRSRKFTEFKKLNGFNSIINIKKVNDFDVVCSTIGKLNSKSLNLYDTRMGFKKPKLNYQSNKVVSNVYDETFQLKDAEFFGLQNSTLIEIFKVSDPVPIKTISKFELSQKKDAVFGGLCFKEDFSFYTTLDEYLMTYKS